MATDTQYGQSQYQPRSDHRRARRTFEDDFLQRCYGDITKMPTLEDASRYLVACVEQQMLGYEAATTSVLEQLCDANAGTNYLERQLEITTVIVGLMRSSEYQTTIDDLVQGLFAHYRLGTLEQRLHEDTARHLVFAIIGWTSMLYTAAFDPHGTQADLAASTLPPRTISVGRRQLSQSSQRPVGALLRSNGYMPIACPQGGHRDQNPATLLAVTHMNFFALSSLGDVTVVWVDDLASHCQFDRYSGRKELKLFRSPSLCAVLCLEKQESLIGWLFRSHTCQNDCRATRATVIQAYLIEVLLTYRLLFGQHHRSRQIFRERQRERAKRNDRVDPLLDALCAQKDVRAYDAVAALLHERGVYNTKTTFPHLGQRLRDLEEYSTDQRPRNLLEVWNDERDPERYLTFRAVLVVGGISILLSFIQVIIGFTQIALSGRNGK